MKPRPFGPERTGLHRFVVATRHGRIAPVPGAVPLHAAVHKLQPRGVWVRSAFREPALRQAALTGLTLANGLQPDRLFVLWGDDPVQVAQAVSDLWQAGALSFSAPMAPLPPQLTVSSPSSSATLEGATVPCLGGDLREPYQGFRHHDSDVFTGKGAGFPHWGVGANKIEHRPWGRGKGAVLRILERGWFLGGTAATPSGCPDLAIDVAHLYASPSGLDIAGGRDAAWSAMVNGTEADAWRHWRNHGLQDLVVLAGLHHNCIGGRGLAPDASFVLHGTWGVPIRPVGGTGDAVRLDDTAADEIDLYTSLFETLLAGSKGDVVLLEDQVLAWGPASTEKPDVEAPLELDPLCHLLLAGMADKGMVVIEPAGNGGADLADLVWPVCDPTSMLKRDRRPIMVGGADPWTHRHKPTLNHGARVDLFAWGDGIETIALRANISGDGYHYGAENGWGGTSGASAIVAGCAAIVQSMAIEAGLGLLGPSEVLDLLQHAATEQEGTPSASIGVMPDLAAIAAHLGLL